MVKQPWYSGKQQWFSIFFQVIGQTRTFVLHPEAGAHHCLPNVVSTFSFPSSIAWPEVSCGQPGLFDLYWPLKTVRYQWAHFAIPRPRVLFINLCATHSFFFTSYALFSLLTTSFQAQFRCLLFFSLAQVTSPTVLLLYLAYLSSLPFITH